MEINNYLIGTLLLLGVLLAVFLSFGWRLWWGFLCPAGALCDRVHIMKVNVFWMVLVGFELFVIWWLGHQLYFNIWCEWAHQIGFDALGYECSCSPEYGGAIADDAKCAD